MKSQVIAVRMDEAQAASLKARARGVGMTAGGYLRRLLDQEAEQDEIAEICRRHNQANIEAVEEMARRVMDATAAWIAAQEQAQDPGQRPDEGMSQGLG